MIYPCSTTNCKSKLQDDLYGKGRRVHNQCKGPIASAVYGRCTVCTTERQVGSQKEEKGGNESKAA